MERIDMPDMLVSGNDQDIVENKRVRNGVGIANPNQYCADDERAAGRDQTIARQAVPRIPLAHDWDR